MANTNYKYCPHCNDGSELERLHDHIDTYKCTVCFTKVTAKEVYEWREQQSAPSVKPTSDP